MKVYVAWSRRGPSTLRRRDGLCAVVSPDGEAVLYVGRDASGPASQPGVRLDPHPLLEQYLREHEIPETDLQEIVGEINLVGGGARSEELVQRTLDVIVLAEEPPGNELPDSSLQLPEETFDVVCQGSCWPGYDRASLAPDGDVVADHVVMGSVFPPPA